MQRQALYKLLQERFSFPHVETDQPTEGPNTAEETPSLPPATGHRGSRTERIRLPKSLGPRFAHVLARHVLSGSWLPTSHLPPLCCYLWAQGQRTHPWGPRSDLPAGRIGGSSALEGGPPSEEESIPRGIFTQSRHVAVCVPRNVLWLAVPPGTPRSSSFQK